MLGGRGGGGAGCAWWLWAGARVRLQFPRWSGTNRSTAIHPKNVRSQRWRSPRKKPGWWRERKPCLRLPLRRRDRKPPARRAWASAVWDCGDCQHLVANELGKLSGVRLARVESIAAGNRRGIRSGQARRQADRRHRRRAGPLAQAVASRKRHPLKKAGRGCVRTWEPQIRSAP